MIHPGATAQEFCRAVAQGSGWQLLAGFKKIVKRNYPECGMKLS